MQYSREGLPTLQFTACCHHRREREARVCESGTTRSSVTTTSASGSASDVRVGEFSRFISSSARRCRSPSTRIC